MGAPHQWVHPISALNVCEADKDGWGLFWAQMRYRTDSFSASKDSQIDSQNEKQPKKRLKHWAVGTGGQYRINKRKLEN